MHVQLKSPDFERRQSAANPLAGLWPIKLEGLPSQDVRMFGASVALAIILVAATTVAIILLVPVVDLRHMLAIYLIPVLAATLRWGFIVGLLTTALSAVTAAFLFYDPIFSFYITNPVEIVSLLIFMATAIVAGYLAMELRATRAKL